jgi:urease accessory protein
MIIVKKLHPHTLERFEEGISLSVERRVLAKRRWRGKALDGTDFGFDLEMPLRNGICFYVEENRSYVIDQKPESVFLVSYTNQEEAAHLAWQVGNLHFPAQFKDTYLMVEGDPAVRLMLERNQIPFQESTEVFQPIVAATSHHHGNGKLLKYFNMW